MIGSIFNEWANDKNPCGWTRDYILVFILVYCEADEVLGTMEIPNDEVMILLLYSGPHGSSCVMSDVEPMLGSHSFHPELWFTVLRIRARELGLLAVVLNPVEQYQ